jgi:hypothetical protein
MTKERFHLRPEGEVTQGETRTACGRRLDLYLGTDPDATQVFRNGAFRIETTVHGTLVTCKGCLKKMRQGKVFA